MNGGAELWGTRASSIFFCQGSVSLITVGPQSATFSRVVESVHRFTALSEQQRRHYASSGGRKYTDVL